MEERRAGAFKDEGDVVEFGVVGYDCAEVGDGWVDLVGFGC